MGKINPNAIGYIPWGEKINLGEWLDRMRDAIGKPQMKMHDVYMKINKIWPQIEVAIEIYYEPPKEEERKAAEWET